MPTSDSEHDPSEEVLYGRLDNVRTLLEALQCLSLPSSAKSQDVELWGHPTRGARFSTVVPGSVLSSVSVPATSFSDYRAAGERIRVNLSLLTDCLSPASGERGAAATLSAAREALRVTLLEDDGARTECVLRTIDGGGAALDAMRAAPRGTPGATAIVRSDVLRDAISELDYGGADAARLRIAPNAPRFVLSAPPPPRRRAVAVELPDPLDGAQDCFDEFRCARTVCASYRLDWLNRVMRALAASDAAKISVGEQGALSVVCKMKAMAPGAAGCFVEFFIVALEIEEDDDDEEDEDGDEEDGDEPMRAADGAVHEVAAVDADGDGW